MPLTLLALAYAIVAALVLNVWVATRWSVHFKFSLVILVAVLYVGTYLGLREIQGWPTTDPMPSSFRLIWAKIEEPDKAFGTEGKIYLWVQELDAASRISGEPRAYKLAYRLDLAEQVEKALNQTEAGSELNGRMTRGILKPQEEDAESGLRDAEQEGESEVTGLSDDRIHLEFTELPKSKLPAKGV
jgi:hypothetical protein